ncbi:(d)CMP kinase [Patescibacteria group bacterium]|nr:(d)CMP kinase [Patescibacteria group bacterium]
MKRYFQIAIDGPVGSGKSTVARLVAERLGWLYVYTGAMYRAAALAAMNAGVPLSDAKAVARLVSEAQIGMSNPVGREVDRRPTTLLLNGKDVSWEILSEEVSKGSSVVAVHKEVREALVIKQQEIARTKNVVMEGRDTTFRVLPDAQLKVFLTAREPERAKRRHQQLLERGEDVDYKQVLGDLKKRDERDSNRKVDPLHVVQDAWVLDTTDLTVSAVVDKILQRVHELT